MKNKKKSVAVIAAVAAALIIFAVVSDIILKNREFEKTDFAMGAVITQKITGKNGERTADEIMAEIRDRENTISWRIENSEIDVLNKKGKAEVSDKTREILIALTDVCEKSSGAVDLTLGNLTGLWNIGSENFKVPEGSDIKKALNGVSWKEVEINGNTVSIGNNQTLDLGFAGKGIACDDAKKILEKAEVSEAIINVGGSLCLYGRDTFTVGIRNPLGDVNDYMAVLNLNEGFVSTSGNYERYSQADGKRYHHILSTDTGYPIENNLLSVTVFCSSGILSDVLSTACYCLGYESSLPLLEEYNAEAVFIFDTNKVKITDGLKNKIEIKNNEFELWKEN